jgi:hypothetical protein
MKYPDVDNLFVGVKTMNARLSGRSYFSLLSSTAMFGGKFDTGNTRARAERKKKSNIVAGRTKEAKHTDARNICAKEEKCLMSLVNT